MFQKNDLVLIADSAVSAFAARKAARRPIAEVTSQNQVQTSLVAETYEDPLERSRPPSKKQKRVNEPKNRSPRPPQQLDGLVNVQGGSLQEGVNEIESGSDSSSKSTSEPETLGQSMATVQRLSTLDPIRSNILSETETEWTVRLHPNDVSIWPVHY